MFPMDRYGLVFESAAGCHQGNLALIAPTNNPGYNEDSYSLMYVKSLFTSIVYLLPYVGGGYGQTVNYHHPQPEIPDSAFFFKFYLCHIKNLFIKEYI